MKLFKGIVIGFLIIISLSSCAQETGLGTLRIQLQNASQKTIGVSAGIYSIVKYQLSGNGPGNSLLSLESSSSLVVREGVQLGDWTFNAKAFNSDGKVVSSGTVSFKLSADSNLVNLVLYEEETTGQAKLTFTWNQELPKPRINLVLENLSTNTKIVKTLTPASNSTSTSISLSDLNPGCYLVKTKLNNDSDFVSGCEEVLIIVSSNRTSGTIDLSEPENKNPSSEDLSIINKNGSKIKGSIHLVSPTQNAGDPVSFALQLDNSYLPASYNIEWYLDGDKIDSTGGQVSFIPQLGSHILNAVFYDNENKSAGSASYKFFSEVSGKSGTVIVDKTIKISAAGCPISAVGENRFLLLDCLNGKLVLFHIENDTFVTDDEVFSYQQNWEFLDNATGIYSSNSLNLFAVTDLDCNINILKYDAINNCLELCYHGKDILRYKAGGSSPEMNFTFIDSIFVGPGPDECGNIIVSDMYIERSLCLQTESDTVVSASSLYDPANHPNIAAFAVCDSYILAVSKTSSSLYAATFDGIGKTGIWKEEKTSLGNLQFLCKLNDNSVVISDGNKICRYSLSGLENWSLRGFADCKVKDIQVSKNGKFIYVLDSENKIETFRLVGSTIEWQDERILPIPAEKIILNDKYILAYSDSNSLVICSIIQEDL